MSTRRAARWEKRFRRLEAPGPGAVRAVRDLPWGWLLAGVAAGALVAGGVVATSLEAFPQDPASALGQGPGTLGS